MNRRDSCREKFEAPLEWLEVPHEWFELAQTQFPKRVSQCEVDRIVRAWVFIIIITIINILTILAIISRCTLLVFFLVFFFLT